MVEEEGKDKVKREVARLIRSIFYNQVAAGRNFVLRRVWYALTLNFDAGKKRREVACLIVRQTLEDRARFFTAQASLSLPPPPTLAPVSEPTLSHKIKYIDKCPPRLNYYGAVVTNFPSSHT